MATAAARWGRKRGKGREGSTMADGQTSARIILILSGCGRKLISLNLGVCVLAQDQGAPPPSDCWQIPDRIPRLCVQIAALHIRAARRYSIVSNVYLFCGYARATQRSGRISAGIINHTALQEWRAIYRLRRMTQHSRCNFESRTKFPRRFHSPLKN